MDNQNVGKETSMKRIIVLLLCLCILLSGCRKGNDAADEMLQDNSRNEADNVDENSGDIRTGNMDGEAAQGKDPDAEGNQEGEVSRLLKLNDAWALVRTVDLKQPDAEMPAFKAEVKPYTVAGDLSNIENINQFEGFTKEQKTMLAGNGFVVLPGGDTKGYYVFDDNEYKGVPNFITSDIALHLYHQFYDKSLMSIEANYMHRDLELMTEQMLQKSVRLYSQLQDEELKELQKKNIVYFAVARMLMLQSEDIEAEDEAWASVSADVLPAAKQEYELARAAEGMELSPLFGVDIDYSQFIVRGHYTRTEELGRYFQAMMWFGYIPLELVDKEGVILYDNVYQSLLITFTTIADSGAVSDAKLWESIYGPTAMYVGLSDDVNVFTMNGLRLDVFGDNEDPNLYNDEGYRDALARAVKELPEPQIQGRIILTTQPTGKQFRFMGQRYVLDSDILQKLMKPILRPMPTALDVMGVLGSPTAEAMIFDELKPQDDWPEYPSVYNELKKQVSGYGADYWKKNLYTGWLSALQDVLKENDKKSGLPFFMTTEAWKYKSLNTAIASYAELKHDTVLYGKQGMAEAGGVIAFAEQHYVEPNPELYHQLLYLAEYTCKVLDDRGMLTENLKRASDSYKKFLELLISCSVKELRNETLSGEEKQQLLWIGGTIENTAMTFMADITNEYYVNDPTDMLITDIATVEHSYLTIGTGYFDHIYVVVPYEGKLYLARGPVYSSYEFVSAERMTDEEWWGLQGITIVRDDYGEYALYGEPSAEVPKQPDWIHAFKSDSNDVIITSLEVIWERLEE